MEAHTCNHPHVPHTVWWWPHDETIAPLSRTFDDLEDADIFAQKIIRTNKERINWLKIFRSDNESYTCYNWTNPEEHKVDPSDQKVKLEIDMEPMKEAFDNIAQGFTDHGTAIRRLRLSQAVIAGVLAVDIALHFLP